MCTVVNLRKSSYDVYCGRAGKGKAGELGNPFIVGIDGARGECVALFRKWIRGQLTDNICYGTGPRNDSGWPPRVFNDPTGIKFRDKIKELVKPGDKLGCFCKPAPCHADSIAEYVNNDFSF